MTLRCVHRTEYSIHWESDERKLYEGDFKKLMEFRLIYEGPLLSNGRASHKHDIRRALHSQLIELWKNQVPLKAIYEHKIKGTRWDGKEGWFRRLDQIADRHIVGKFRFAPLICQDFGLACKLDILFLRRQNPGELVGHGGDLDNRMKTLLDALQIPKDLDGDLAPEKTEDPFFVLLEDDALITDVRVNTDRLLVPVEEGFDSSQKQNNVHLVIHVESLIVKPDVSYVEFGLR